MDFLSPILCVVQEFIDTILGIVNAVLELIGMDPIAIDPIAECE